MSGRARRLPTAAQLQLEGVLLAGGLRALLLQLAHPAVGHGVAEHSDFRGDPLARLRSTLKYVYVVAAGEEGLTRRVGRAVGEAHRPVVSGEGAAARYDARDPALQLWVAASIHDTAMRIAEAVWGPLPAPLADELLALDGRLATVLGLPAEEWPATREAFDARLAGAAAALAFDAVTLDVVRALVRPSGVPLAVRLAMPLLARATLPTLPGLEASLGPALRLRAPNVLPLARAIAPAWRLLPAALRRLPARRLLEEARADTSDADARPT